MTFYDIIFYLIAVTIVISAATVILSGKKINIIAGLFCTFMGVSGLLAILSAVSLALLYMIFFGIVLSSLFLFVLPDIAKTDEPEAKKSSSILPVMMTGITAALLTGTMITTRWNVIPQGENGFSFVNLTSLLTGKYSLPLILLPLILFTVIIGAFFLLRQDRE